MCAFGGWTNGDDRYKAGSFRPPIQDSDEARYRAEVAAYIAELTTDLALKARKHGLDSLGYILEMAKLEAENATRHVKGCR